MNKTYIMPVVVEIDAENPDRIAKEIGETIYDSVRIYIESPWCDVEHIDVEYSIFVKGDSKTFGNRHGEVQVKAGADDVDDD